LEKPNATWTTFTAGIAIMTPHDTSAETLSRQIVGIDFLRFAAAFAVMLFHFAYETSDLARTPGRLTQGIVAYPWLADYASYGWMGVPVFFVISGFVISLSAQNADAAKFMAGRILRLAPGVWICATITAIVAIIAGDGTVLKVIGRFLTSAVFSPFGKQIDGTYWTLSIEIAFYISIFYLLLKNKMKYFNAYIYYLAIMSATFNIIELFYGRIGIPSKAANLLLIQYGCEFALGARLFGIMQNRSRNKSAYAATLVAALGSYAQVMKGVDSQAVWIVFGIWTFSMSAIIMSVAINEKLTTYLPRPLVAASRELGKFTYPLYLIHQLVGSFLLYTLVTRGVGQNAALAITLAGMIGLAAAISIAEVALRARLKPSIQNFSRKSVARLTSSKAKAIAT
jgi:peptidoglycan/LPS O-acetylase OafA/YrhL